MMIGRIVTRFASRLRYPTLFKVVAGVFLIDLIVPDLLPFADEILLALATLLLAAFKRRSGSSFPAVSFSSAR